MRIINNSTTYCRHTYLNNVPGCDLYVGGGDAVTGGMLVCLSNSNSLSRYSCMDAWYDGGGALYSNSGYIIAVSQSRKNYKFNNMYICWWYWQWEKELLFLFAMTIFVYLRTDDVDGRRKAATWVRTGGWLRPSRLAICLTRTLPRMTMPLGPPLIATLYH